MAEPEKEIIELLERAYCMEIETVANHLANSINLEGIRAEFIKGILSDSIHDEIKHAIELGNRIKELGGVLPGSAKLQIGGQVQPPDDTTDVVAVIEGVIASEVDACANYMRIIDLSHAIDPVTADLCTRLLADEQHHLILFRGFLKEYNRHR